MAGPELELTLNPTENILRKRGLDKGGAVQRAVDKAVIDLCEPYVPFDTGALKESPKTCSSPGKVVYGMPYARKQYYENKGDGGLRGARWFERMKADHMGDIVEIAEETMKKSGGQKGAAN